MKRTNLLKKIFEVNAERFETVAIEIFQYQFNNNLVYGEYCRLLGRNEKQVKKLSDIPFLPISFFKTHEVVTGSFIPEKAFVSSGTTGKQTSNHFISDIALYEKSFTQCFHIFFGDPNQYAILGLLPSYSERPDSSLVYMATELMRLSGHSANSFFLDNHAELNQTLTELEIVGQKTILIGVTFALLEYINKYPGPIPHVTVIETGGMKGRKPELTREEVHSLIKDALLPRKICSEYGMTELMSQAYSLSDGIFFSPPWLKIMTRDVNDPLSFLYDNSTGAINIIDLANLDSCCFIATDDLGTTHENDSFEIKGRLDYSDIRGCNLMVELST